MGAHGGGSATGVTEKVRPYCNKGMVTKRLTPVVATAAFEAETSNTGLDYKIHHLLTTIRKEDPTNKHKVNNEQI